MNTLSNFYGKAGRIACLVLLAATLIFIAGPLARAQEPGGLLLVENVGQFSDLPDGQPVVFRAYGERMTLSLAPDALWLTALEPGASQRGVTLRLGFAGANPETRLEPFDPLETQVSYFSSGPAGSQTSVPAWGGVRYAGLYPGLDLEISGGSGGWVPRLVTRDGSLAEPESVRLQIEGAESLALAGGRLLAGTSIGEIELPLLQFTGSDGKPEIEGLEVSQPFTPPVETEMPVAIQDAADLVYSSFLGGSSGGEAGRAIAADAAGSAYVTGETYSADFPTTPGAFDTDPGGGDVFVVKFTPDGSDLVYATFLDGGQGFGLAVDEAGQATVTGRTFSPDFPVTAGAFGSDYNGNGDAFVARLSPDGTDLVYAGLLGGGEAELGAAVALDLDGKTYVTGFTASPDFPADNGSYTGGGTFGYDTFIARVSESGSALDYATLLGGSADDQGQAIAVDAAGSAYVAGQTESTNFPTTAGALETSYRRSFVVKLLPDGSSPAYATYLGGSGNDFAHGIAVDAAGHAYVTGETTATNFPVTAGAFQTSYHSTGDITHEGDAFVVKLNPAGSGLVYGTYLGGTDRDIGFGLAVDAAGYATITGVTYSDDLPTTPDSFQPTRSGYPDAFLARLNPAGSDLNYGTFLGGSQGEAGYSVAVGEGGQVYLTGYSSSADFPTTAGVFAPSPAGSSAAFVAKFALPAGPVEPTPTPTVTPAPLPTPTCAPTLLGSVTVGNEPRGIAVNPDQDRVYVANYGSSSLSVIDGSTATVAQTVANIPSANGVAYDPTQNLIWVSNYETGQVTPINAASLTPLPAVTVGEGPWGVAYDPIHNYIYVANSLADTVSVIDAAAQAVVTTLGDFKQPFEVAANPVTGKVYVANFDGHSVSVLDGAAVSRVVDLYDSVQPYGLAVDETRNLVYVATVGPHRIVAIGPIPGRGPDQFLGWAAFYRGFGDRHRPLPLRAIAVNPAIGPAGDGGHLWTTTTTADGSESGQALFIPKGWGGYFHYPIIGQNQPELAPEGGLTIDRSRNRVYVTSGGAPGTVTILGDHANVCPVVAPAEAGPDTFDFDFFSVLDLAQGDATGDGQVNIFDLSLIAARYGTADPAADVNGDGQVNILDLAAAAGNFGRRFR